MRLVLLATVLIALAGCSDKPGDTPATKTDAAASAMDGQGLAIPIQQDMPYDQARKAIAGAGWQRTERWAYVGSSGKGESDPCQLDGLDRAGPALCARYPEMQMCDEGACQMRFVDAKGQKLVVLTTPVTPSAPPPTVMSWSLEAPEPVDPGPAEAPAAQSLPAPEPQAASSPAPASIPEFEAHRGGNLSEVEWVTMCATGMNEQMRTSAGPARQAQLEMLVLARCQCLVKNGAPDDLAEMAWLFDVTAGMRAGEIPEPTDPMVKAAALRRFQSAEAAAVRAGATCD